MHDILDFISRHWLLAALTVVAFLWVIVEEARRQSGGRYGLSPQETVNKINHDDAVVLDIREPSAFANGHITGAINITKQEIERDPTVVDKYKNKPLIVVCMAGVNAQKIVNVLSKRDFTQLYLLSGGLTAWTTAGLPLVKGNK